MLPRPALLPPAPLLQHSSTANTAKERRMPATSRAKEPWTVFVGTPCTGLPQHPAPCADLHVGHRDDGGGADAAPGAGSALVLCRPVHLSGEGYGLMLQSFGLILILCNVTIFHFIINPDCSILRSSSLNLVEGIRYLRHNSYLIAN